MAEVRRVLCPIDFSETSRAALRWAVEIARRYEADLTLFHVFQPPTFSVPEGVIAGASDLLSDVPLQLDAALRQWTVAAEALGPPRPVVTGSAVGVTHIEICRAAREGDHQMIVIGTHGRTGLTHVLLGSTAEKVVRHASCPVLTVRGPE